LPGKSNSKADILSRRPGFNQGKDDNEDITILPPDLFQNTISISALHTSTPSDAVFDLTVIPFHSRIHRVRNNLDHSVKIALNRKDEGWKTLEDGTHTFKDRIYVQIDKKLREDIIHEHHDSPLAGHPGQHRTAELILRDYWWPRIANDVRVYVEGCETCQRTKPHRTPVATPLHPFHPPTRPWEVITIDLIGPLPESQGYNVILVIVDWFSKMVKFEATHMELTAQGIATALCDRIF